MPSPSKLSLALGRVVTGGVFYGGAWLASRLTSDAAVVNEPAERNYYVPAPIPGLSERGSISDPTEVSGSAEPLPIVVSDREEERKPVSSGLTLTIEGVRSTNGEIIVIVYDDAAAYASDDFNSAVGFAEISAAKGTLTYQFTQLSGGPYAISLFHDENGNDDFDMDGQYPLEGYGISGSKGPYDEPDFRQASVQSGAVTVKMHYLQ